MSSGLKILAFAAAATLGAISCNPPDRAADVIPPMSFRLVSSGGNCIDCVWIAAEGAIAAETVERFHVFLGAEGGASLIALHSPGGDLEAGIALGRLIRGRGMRATVASTASGADGVAHRQTGDCASACVMAFLGGVERTVPSGSRLGVHQFRGAEASIGEAEVQGVVAGLGDYLMEMGVSRDLLIDASRTPPDQIDWVTAERLEDFHLVTSRARPAEAAWRIGTMDAALVLMADQPQPNGQTTRYYVACSTDYPGEYLFGWARPLGSMGPEAGLALAQEVTSLAFFNASAQLSPSYATAGSAGNGEFIVVAGVPRADLRQLAVWDEPLILQLSGYPQVAGAAFGAAGHLIPRNGLSDLLQHLDRNCAS